MRIRIAVTAAAVVLSVPLVGAPSWADCIMYEKPDICEAASTLSDGFWIGEYSVAAGAGTFAIRTGTHTIPPAGMQPATVFEQGGDLVIVHPRRELNASLVSLATDYPAWGWDEGAGDMSLNDMTLLAGCHSEELPRWIADTSSDDGVPMTLELVAVWPTLIMGRLSAEGVKDGYAFTYQRHLDFKRDDYPVENLEETIRSSEECELLCPEEPHLCPDWP